jgi:2-C-methyl-D-erythritol 2,4-cyclodiphosphate synthase
MVVVQFNFLQRVTVRAGLVPAAAGRPQGSPVQIFTKLDHDQIDKSNSRGEESAVQSDYRIGQGLDIHRFARGRKLVLGGVEIPHHSGLLGHSDADVLLHALMNAMLGALGESDIGTHFPDSDPRYKNIASTALLRRVIALMKKSGFALVNADMTVVAQEPRLAPFFSAIRKKIARLARVNEKQINIKAGTPEKLGWLGKGEGIIATAVVLLKKNPPRKGRKS